MPTGEIPGALVRRTPKEERERALPCLEDEPWEMSVVCWRKPKDIGLLAARCTGDRLGPG